MTQWSLRLFNPHDQSETEAVIYYDDETEARIAFEGTQKRIAREGGGVELLRDGVYVCLFSCTPPEVKP